MSEPPDYAGQEIDYSLKVLNRGLNDVDDVVVSLLSQENLSLVWASSQNCSTLGCTVPFLDFDQSEDFIIKMKITEVGDFDLTAKSTSNYFDPVSSDNIDDSNNGGTAVELPDDLIFADDFEGDLMNNFN